MVTEMQNNHRIEAMKPYINKLLSHLLNKGIEFIEKDGEMPNVIFKLKGQELKIAWHMFYRGSGIACIYKDGKEKNSIEIVEVDDEMFYGSYMKSIIEHNFTMKQK